MKEKPIKVGGLEVKPEDEVVTGGLLSLLLGKGTVRGGFRIPSRDEFERHLKNNEGAIELTSNSWHAVTEPWLDRNQVRVIAHGDPNKGDPILVRLVRNVKP